MKTYSKGSVLEGGKLNYNASYQKEFVNDLVGLVKRMTRIVRREVIGFFKSPVSKDFYAGLQESVALDESIASQANILTNALTARFDILFKRRSKTLAKRLVKGAQVASKVSMNASLKKLNPDYAIKTDFKTNGLKDILKGSVSENVEYITSISDVYLSKVKKAVLRSVTTGRGLQDLIPELDEYLEKSGEISERHAKNLALDQTRKVYNTMNRERMLSHDIKKFKWLHSFGGQHPREDHVKMNGMIFSFDDLPVVNSKTGDRGIPGQEPGCKCTMVPVILLDDGTEV